MSEMLLIIGSILLVEGAMIRPLLLAFLSMLVFEAVVFAESGPVFSDTGPEAEEYGASRGYPVPPFEYPPGRGQDFMVGTYSHFDKVRPVRPVEKPATPSVLKRAAEEIAPVYHYDGRQKAIGDYLDAHPVTGLLIARGDTILLEHYQYARTDKDRFLSQSMVKTLTGLLVGIAVSEGAIHSIDDTAATYVPELEGTAYGATPLRALLHMSSGVAFAERTYQSDDDIFRLHLGLLGNNAVGAVAALRQFNRRDAQPNTRFAYASSETEVLGLVVSRAVHMPLSDYLATRIWQKLGAESDAAWAIDPTGQEVAYCCFIATLRDWARLGLMLANDGAWNGQQIIPRQWLLDATTVAPDSYLRNTIAQSWGYGYQVWILPGERRMFLLLGIHGQGLFVDPESKLIMVQTAVRKLPVGNPKSPEAMALWYAVVAQFGHR
ncbi:serine hydrolase domain-containing protein [Bradyrhizobium zhanjiangense]|uniref:serine hydrolase domain-containing protein n=1 Tax=Bradyrhizobium zhanjiangense TaxID=1325107 RepID=UPI001FE01299|nr:serine hydrolase [Bradyrhizobium zhanjiangense]